MKRHISAVLTGLVSAFLLCAGTAAVAEEEKSGEQLFQEHCAMCHPGGGNIVRPGKTLFRHDLDANRIKTLDDIVWLMRNPDVGMTRFHVDVLPDAEARRIARYVMNTFR